MLTSADRLLDIGDQVDRHRASGCQRMSAEEPVRGRALSVEDQRPVRASPHGSEPTALWRAPPERARRAPPDAPTSSTSSSRRWRSAPSLSRSSSRRRSSSAASTRRRREANSSASWAWTSVCSSALTVDNLVAGRHRFHQRGLRQDRRSCTRTAKGCPALSTKVAVRAPNGRRGPPGPRRRDSALVRPNNRPPASDPPASPPRPRAKSPTSSHPARRPDPPRTIRPRPVGQRSGRGRRNTAWPDRAHGYCVGRVDVAEDRPQHRTGNEHAGEGRRGHERRSTSRTEMTISDGQPAATTPTRAHARTIADASLRQTGTSRAATYPVTTATTSSRERQRLPG